MKQYQGCYPTDPVEDASSTHVCENGPRSPVHSGEMWKPPGCPPTGDSRTLWVQPRGGSLSTCWERTRAAHADPEQSQRDAISFYFFLKQDVELAFTQYSVHIEYGDTGEMVKQSYFWSVGIKVWGREVCFIDFSLDNLVNNLTFTTGVDYFCRT